MKYACEIRGSVKELVQLYIMEFYICYLSTYMSSILSLISVYIEKGIYYLITFCFVEAVLVF